MRSVCSCRQDNYPQLTDIELRKALATNPDSAVLLFAISPDRLGVCTGKAEALITQILLGMRPGAPGRPPIVLNVRVEMEPLELLLSGSFANTNLVERILSIERPLLAKARRGESTTTANSRGAIIVS